MNEIISSSLSDQTKDYFNSKFNQKQSCSKKLSKCVVAFDYIDKVLIVLFATNGGVSIISLLLVFMQE